ncbi:hypothetical protein JYG23_00115 [Sedimentibacter sp. zth1]|uniref:hypothetical protein n=1 Tax=Sedimentibacter sp. zth1 TaxID=2816908 RepID=UPI001A93731D|nr:hypothetical protein [Sedimentibacter sp. zth1]QSX05912.1 hypothetical protein JYG23_00115 [Sedimentibacter sp. zth1]
MPITIAGLKSMGFEKFENEESISSCFYSINIIEIFGINLENIIPDTLKQIDTNSKKCIIWIEESKNELLKSLIAKNLIVNSDILDKDLIDENTNDNCYYMAVILNTEKDYICESGYKKTENNVILTHNCFEKAKQELKDLESMVIPKLITTLNIELAQYNDDITVRLMNNDILGKDSKGNIIFDVKLDMQCSLSVIKPLKLETLRYSINNSLNLYNDVDTKVISLLYSGLNEKDRFKKFINIFQALEMHINKVFKKIKKIDLDKKADGQFICSDIFKETAKKTFIDCVSSSKNLAHKFIWCSMLEWTNVNDNDVSVFMSIKKIRDDISHCNSVLDCDLPIQELINLIYKIIRK